MKNNEIALAAHNCIQTIVLPDRYTTFRRFTKLQMAEYGKDFLFSTMSQCPSGVYLAIKTNGNMLSFKVNTEKTAVYLPALTEMKKKDWKSALSQITAGVIGDSIMELKDTFDIVIDNQRTISTKFKKGKITVALGNPHPLEDVLALKIYLPVFPFVAVADFESDGDVWVDAGTEFRHVCYCFGDSITQGFNAHMPSMTYTSLIGQHYDMEMLNFGVGGYWFERKSLGGMEDLPKPDMVIIAYGTNDWVMVSSMEQMRENVCGFLDEIDNLYNGIPTYLITPIWRADKDTQHGVGKFEDMCSMVKEEALKHKDIKVLDGLKIPLADPKLFGDGFLHPNAEGFRILSSYLREEMGNEPWHGFKHS